MEFLFNFSAVLLSLVLGLHVLMDKSKSKFMEMGHVSLDSLEEVKRTNTTLAKGINLMFVNFFESPVEIYFKPTNMFCGRLEHHQNTSINTYNGHEFVIKRDQEVVQQVKVRENTTGLIFVGQDESELYQSLLEKQRWLMQYQRKHGIPWLSGREPGDSVHLPFWDFDEIGQTMRFKHGKLNNITFIGVSKKPRILLVKNLLSKEEVDHILAIGEPKLKRSSIGQDSHGFTSETRTSSNGWIAHDETPLVRILMERFAKVQLMDFEKDQDRMELLQFVRYNHGEQYQAHHDFSVSPTSQRFSTLLIYLKTPREGGATSFPHADGGALELKAKSGDAVLFYSMTEDGNGDVRSLHAGLPVNSQDQKWVVNLWTWYPRRR